MHDVNHNCMHFNLFLSFFLSFFNSSASVVSSTSGRWGHQHATNVRTMWQNKSGKWRSKQPWVASVLEEIIQVAGCGAALSLLASIPPWLQSGDGVLLLSPASRAPHSTPDVWTAKLADILRGGDRGLASHLSGRKSGLNVWITTLKMCVYPTSHHVSLMGNIGCRETFGSAFLTPCDFLNIIVPSEAKVSHKHLLWPATRRRPFDVAVVSKQCDTNYAGSRFMTPSLVV